MATKYGELKVDTPDGAKSLPVYNKGSSGSSVYEVLKVDTPSGVGYIPLVDPSKASHPYLKVQTNNHGILAVHKDPSINTGWAHVEGTNQRLRGGSEADNVWSDSSKTQEIWNSGNPQPPKTIDSKNMELYIDTTNTPSESASSISLETLGNNNEGFLYYTLSIDMSKADKLELKTELDTVYNNGMEIYIGGDRKVVDDNNSGSTGWENRSFDISSYSGYTNLKIGHDGQTTSYNYRRVSMSYIRLLIERISTTDFNTYEDNSSNNNGYSRIDNGDIELKAEQTGGSNTPSAYANTTKDLTDLDQLTVDWYYELKSISYTYGSLYGRVYIIVGGDRLVTYEGPDDSTESNTETKNLDVSSYSGSTKIEIKAESLASTSLSDTGNYAIANVTNIDLS
jgi:hypothetical protein